MENKNLIYIVGGLAFLGIGYYFYTKNKKPSNQSGTTEDGTMEGGGMPSQFDSEEKIMAFQNWVLNDKGDKEILGKYGADGKWGSFTQGAWDKYGKDYKPKSN